MRPTPSSKASGVSARGVHVQPTVYGGRYVDLEPRVGHYYPSLGHVPGYGRLEIEPPPSRLLPTPGPSYHQSWSAQSTPQPEVPFYPPPVIVAPPYGDGAMPRDQAIPPRDFQHRKSASRFHGKSDKPL